MAHETFAMPETISMPQVSSTFENLLRPCGGSIFEEALMDDIGVFAYQVGTTCEGI